MLNFRKAIAILALLTFAGLIVTFEPVGPPGLNGGLRTAGLALLWPLAACIGAVAWNRPLGRWVALASAIAVLPWATVLTFGPTYGAPIVRQAIALVAALVLLGSLSGDRVYGVFEGRAQGIDWRAPKMSLVRGAIICNLASILTLFFFVVAYEPRGGTRLVGLGLLMLGLAVGVFALAYQKAFGLVLVALCCAAFIPVGANFVAREAVGAAEAILFAVVFTPGLVTGLACLIAFARPIWIRLKAS